MTKECTVSRGEIRTWNRPLKKESPENTPGLGEIKWGTEGCKTGGRDHIPFSNKGKGRGKRHRKNDCYVPGEKTRLMESENFPYSKEGGKEGIQQKEVACSGGRRPWGRHYLGGAKKRKFAGKRLTKSISMKKFLKK